MQRLLCLATLLVSLPCAAATVYKSVDAQGRVTFSDQPPAEDTLVEVLDYSVTPPLVTEADAQRMVAVREVTERMVADRQSREAERKEARRIPESTPTPVPQQARGYLVSRRYPLYSNLPLAPPAHSGQPAIHSQYPAKLVRRLYSDRVREVFQ